MEKGLILELADMEKNATQELFGLESKLNEVEERTSTQELLDLLEGNDAADVENGLTQENNVKTTGKGRPLRKSARNKNLSQQDIDAIFSGDTSQKTEGTSQVKKSEVNTRKRQSSVETEHASKKTKEERESSDESEDDAVLSRINKKLDNRPVQVTLIKGKKRIKKAELDKTWQQLTGKPIAGTSGTSEKSKPASELPNPVEITVIKKRRGRKPKNPDKVKREVVWLFCDLCPFKTYTQNSFVQHRLIHSVLTESEVPTFYCNRCRFTTTTDELLQQHKATHETSNLSYKCVFCDEFFKKKTSCMYHTLRHDDQDVASRFYCLVYSTNVDEEYFECYQCDYQNPEENSMPDHVIDHTLEIPKLQLVAKFKCNECQYRTKTEEMLKRHKLLHEERRRKKGKKATEDVKTEPDIEPQVVDPDKLPLLKCPKCQYVTRHKRSLSNHIGLKHNRLVPPLVAGEAASAKALDEGKTLYYCNECSYSTYRKLNMPRHMLVHKTKENMELFECPHCIFETKHRRSYTRHLEAKHGVIV
ncbi:hypothetical protein ABEB36_009992 [Hypothenemus hampei]